MSNVNLGNRRRESINTNQNFGEVRESFLACNLAIENLAKCMKTDLTQIFDNNQIELWSGEIHKLSKEFATSERMLEVTENYIENNLKRSHQGDVSAISDITSNIKKIKADISETIKNDRYKPESSAIVKLVQNILEVERENIDEDDIIVSEGVDVESHFRCPFTGTKMEIPMGHDSCRHHISKQGLDVLLKNKHRTASCPVPGCAAKWTAATSVLDKAFEKRMDRFYRLQESTSVDAKYTEEILDEAEEYTQV